MHKVLGCMDVLTACLWGCKHTVTQHSGLEGHMKKRQWLKPFQWQSCHWVLASIFFSKIFFIIIFCCCGDCLFCCFVWLFFFLWVSVLDLGGKQYQKNPPGVLQNTSLLQLLLCTRYKITLYIAFYRNPLCAAPNQSKETWAYLYYLCYALSVMTFLLLRHLNKELTSEKGGVLIALCMWKYRKLLFEKLEVSNLRLALFSIFFFFFFWLLFHFLALFFFLNYKIIGLPSLLQNAPVWICLVFYPSF